MFEWIQRAMAIFPNALILPLYQQNKTEINV